MHKSTPPEADRLKTAEQIKEVVHWFGVHLADPRTELGPSILNWAFGLPKAIKTLGLPPGPMLRLVQCVKSGGTASDYPDWQADEVALQEYVLDLQQAPSASSGSPEPAGAEEGGQAEQMVRMTTSEAADYIMISAKAMRSWIKDSKLAAEDVGSGVFEFHQRELDTHRAAQEAKNKRLAKK